MAALEPIGPDDLGFVLEAIRQARAALAGQVPLIGFAGAPFTLASYAIEGGGSRNYVETKRLMYGDPEAWHDLMGRLADAVAGFLLAQVAAGAQAVQLFDSWVGALSPDDYAEYAYPYTQRIFAALADTGVPRIHFGTGANTLLPLMANAGCDVIGLDWRIPLDDGLGRGRARTWPCRATSTRWCSSPPTTRSSGGCSTSSSGPTAGPATSSTWATASCPRPRRRRSGS